jgi:hypothetical protein
MENARSWDTIHGPNLQIIGIEEEVQVKEIGNIFNKVIGERFTNLEKELLKKKQETFKTPNRKEPLQEYDSQKIKYTEQ